MAKPDPTEPYGMPDCPHPLCGLPRTAAGRAQAGWVQVHYAPSRDAIEPDRWYCGAQCAARGLVHADIVATRTPAIDAACRAERARRLALLEPAPELPAADPYAEHREQAEAADAAETVHFSDLGVVGSDAGIAAERAIAVLPGQPG